MSNYINTKAIKSSTQARETFGRMFFTANDSKAIQALRDRAYGFQFNTFVAESGNEYYSVIVSRYSQRITEVKIGSWNVNGNYAYNEQYTGNPQQLIRKIRSRIQWIAETAPERLAEGYDGSYDSNRAAGRQLTAEERAALFAA